MTRPKAHVTAKPKVKPRRKAVSPRSLANLKPSKPGARTPGSGRKKGTPNKISSDIKAALIEAANLASAEGMVGYFVEQAAANPKAFLTLLGRAMPLTVQAEGTLTLEALVLAAAKEREDRDGGGQSQA